MRNSADDQNVIDFTLFQQTSMADCVCDFAKVVRQETNSRKLCVFFYGYAYEFGPAQNGPANAGHYALRRILESPDIDAIASPWSYDDRGLGGTGPIMTPCDSIALAGKLYIAEDDTATNLSAGDAPGWNYRATSVTDTNQVLLRNSAEMSLRNIGTWWMDLGRSGWFDDPGYWDTLRRFAPVSKSQLTNARPFHPQIASVVDENSVPLFAWHGRAGTILSESRAAIGRVGAPYGQYLQDDVEKRKVHAKLYIFLCSYSSTQTQRDALLEATDHAVSVWCYAPGYIDNGAVSLKSVDAVTGFKVALVKNIVAMVMPTTEGLSKGLTRSFGINATLDPMLCIVDARPSEILATYPDGSTAIAMRRYGSRISIFVGVPVLTPEIIHLAAVTAGVHLYANNEAATFANGPFIAVHATKTAVVTIDTGSDKEITDILSGEKLGRGPTVTLPLSSGDTRIVRSGP